jgi:two-component system sensor histidine kinase CpxA
MTDRSQRFIAPRLFVRIFLWFWIATVILLATYTLSAGSLRPAWGVAARELVPYVGARAGDAFESGRSEALREYLDNLERRSQVRAYLLDADGNAPLEELVPSEAIAVASKVKSNRTLRSARTRAGVWLAARVVASSGTAYCFVALVPWRLFLVALPADSPIWFPAVTLALVAGLIWWWLARRLAMPATVLRAAARRFAAGDLSVRITNARVFHPRDEISDLAHEFNAMADRIENLILTQKRVIGDISHELGSPLARLRLAVGLARKQLGQSAQAPLDRIEKEAERLDGLTQHVLDLMRVDTAPVAPPTRLRVDELVKELVADADLEASAKGCRVSIGTAVVCHAEIYPDLLRSALENVIRNAVKYTAANTSVNVEISPSRAGSCVHILVRDHGPGVPEDALPHLFEPFYRVHSARDRQSGGTGLGLSIARQAVERHGGDIRARNLQEGGLEVDIRIEAAIEAG